MTLSMTRPSALRSAFAPLARRCAAPVLLAVLFTLTACGTATRTVPQTGAATAPGSAPGPAYGGKPPSGGYRWTPEMATSLTQLSPALRGTPVVLTRTQDNRLWLTLPGDLSFETNRSALKPGARAVLDQVALALRGNDGARLRIVGHTDGKGAAAANDALSIDRAASTRDWLVARGLAPTRFAVAGRGARDPVASNDDDTGRARNRRVEILIGDERSR